MQESKNREDTVDKNKIQKELIRQYNSIEEEKTNKNKLRNIREILEMLISIIKRMNNLKKKKDSLEREIKLLCDKKIIDRKIFTYMKIIRQMSNPSHHYNPGYSYTESDLNICITALIEILRWFFSNYNFENHILKETAKEQMKIVISDDVGRTTNITLSKEEYCNYKEKYQISRAASMLDSFEDIYMVLKDIEIKNIKDIELINYIAYSRDLSLFCKELGINRKSKYEIWDIIKNANKMQVIKSLLKNNPISLLAKAISLKNRGENYFKLDKILFDRYIESYG